jgi:hypothetical protein
MAFRRPSHNALARGTASDLLFGAITETIPSFELLSENSFMKSYVPFIAAGPGSYDGFIL